MNESDKMFFEIFNNYYPFESYIVKEPKPINRLFDNVQLLEIYIPKTDIIPLLDDNGNLITFTRNRKIDEDILIKLKGPAGEFKLAYMDFNEHVRETIREIIIKDFGDCEWQSLYIDCGDEEDNNQLEKALQVQRELIEKEYGFCYTKE